MILLKLVGLASPLIAWLGTAWLIVTGSGVEVESSDVANVANANTGFLTSIFQITEFIPTIAIMAGWIYLLNKVFSFIPKAGGSN